MEGGYTYVGLGYTSAIGGDVVGVRYTTLKTCSNLPLTVEL
jgi:hypothetical protein